MRTSIPTVRVMPVRGYQVTCNKCPNLVALRGTRQAADQAAVEHQNKHADRGA